MSQKHQSAKMQKLLLKVKVFAVSNFFRKIRKSAILLLWFVLPSQFSLERAFDIRSCYSALSSRLRRRRNCKRSSKVTGLVTKLIVLLWSFQSLLAASFSGHAKITRGPRSHALLHEDLILGKIAKHVQCK